MSFLRVWSSLPGGSCTARLKCAMRSSSLSLADSSSSISPAVCWESTIMSRVPAYATVP
eukprot:CAMPEP_0169465028 /NCGR_PEP_ID=MMETSP1042-20121227/20988_1 /TAXON_ID=464988 /ORGANISM="Hemiselmis andersenii, Strain CCMP1180" /LENGTH=58 /DNA_ID=CAMNT_0009577931 /DNA_START=422 /DNA_END=595 /DNA_ORIENTATION=-